jgi:hypothetical protein
MRPAPRPGLGDQGRRPGGAGPGRTTAGPGPEVFRSRDQDGLPYALSTKANR